MTVEEAQMKVCCGPEGSGRFNEQPWPARWCVGPDCMAWRTAQIGRVQEGDEYKTYREEGYCGLAGKP